jgi:hypothetical protein
MPTQTFTELVTPIASQSSWRLIYPYLENEIRTLISDLPRPLFIGDRDLTRQLLLHLPRFSAEELGEASVIRAEAERLLSKIELRRLSNGFWRNRRSIDSFVKQDVSIRECNPQVARLIHESFHYIGSYHEGFAHLGLFHRQDEEFPVALASLAPMDIHRLEARFPSAEDRKKVLVVSRVFAFDWAPRNTISSLLGGVRRWLRNNMPEVQSLLTFLNPNLGFTGTSFKASNWKFYLEIEPASSYIDGDYVSYRALAGFPRDLRKNARRSLHHLAPLKLLRYDLQTRGDQVGYSSSFRY